MKLLFENWQKYLNEIDSKGFPTPEESYEAPKRKITPITSPVSWGERIKEKERQFIAYALSAGWTHHSIDNAAVPAGWKTRSVRHIARDIYYEAAGTGWYKPGLQDFGDEWFPPLVRVSAEEFPYTGDVYGDPLSRRGPGWGKGHAADVAVSPDDLLPGKREAKLATFLNWATEQAMSALGDLLIKEEKALVVYKHKFKIRIMR